MLCDITVGFAMCGSFCTFERAFGVMRKIKEEGAELLPIMSFAASSVDTRFGAAKDFVAKAEEISGRGVIKTIEDAEPIGPKKLCDVLLVAPCTGNTLAKLCAGIVDTPVTMAVKSHLRNARPVVIALSTNDALAAAGKNIGELMNRRNYYFAPLLQDDPFAKPTSLAADFEMIPSAVRLALDSVQIQPMLSR